jgi:hypothetical protein
MTTSDRTMTQVATCPGCSKAISRSQSESWCLGCGTPLGQEITDLLPSVLAQRSVVARELASEQPAVAVSRGERVFRGMLGMGMAYAAVAAALMVALSAVAIAATLRGEITDFTDDLDFMIVAAIGWPAIAFALGMLYAGVLALVARGRSFREVSVARVGLAGAAIGLIPNVVVAVGTWFGQGTLTVNEILDPLFIFPPISAMIAVATLLIARRAKPRVADGRNG